MKIYKLSCALIFTYLLLNCMLSTRINAAEGNEAVSLNAPAFTMDSFNQADRQFIAADNPDLYYIGRIDTRDPKMPVFNWQGTEVRARFTGKTIGIRFANAWGQNFYNVIVDGKIYLLKLESGLHDYFLTQTLPGKQHEVILFKRTEAMFSGATFCGFNLEKDARFGPKPKVLPLRIEFYGDSITVGACNEDPATGPDQYENYITHNNYLAYGAITARNIKAEYVCIAVSGTGLCYSWNPVGMFDTYNKINPNSIKRKYDFSGRKPDIVVINLGQNDYGFPSSQGKPFPSDFTEKYVQFVGNIRSLYPDAKIVCSIGGMSAYHDSKELQSSFQNAVDILKAKDNKIYSYVFKAFTYNHPRQDTHTKMAEELTDFLKRKVL